MAKFQSLKPAINEVNPYIYFVETSFYTDSRYGQV